MSAKATKPPGKISKIADAGKKIGAKIGKTLSKFPKLAKSMKFLTKIPFVTFHQQQNTSKLSSEDKYILSFLLHNANQDKLTVDD